MGLTTSRMDTLVKNLSGGERARLLLGLITFGGPGMLILDEPTNHLDIDSRDALVEALNDYTGAVLIISHDRHLIEATVDKLWIAQNGTIEEFDEDLDCYQRMLTSGKDKPQANRAAACRRGRQEGRAAGQRRQAPLEVAPLRKSIKDAEQKLGAAADRTREGRGDPRRPQDLRRRAGADRPARQGQGALRRRDRQDRRKLARAQRTTRGGGAGLSRLARSRSRATLITRITADESHGPG